MFGGLHSGAAFYRTGKEGANHMLSGKRSLIRGFRRSNNTAPPSPATHARRGVHPCAPNVDIKLVVSAKPDPSSRLLSLSPSLSLIDQGKAGSLSSSFSPFLLVRIEQRLAPVMKPALSLSTLFASILILLAATEAAPAKRTRTITLPLKRIQQNRTDVHPAIVSSRVTHHRLTIGRMLTGLRVLNQHLQRHINRGQSRIARMKRAAIPNKRDLEERPSKRMFMPKGGWPKVNSGRDSRSTMLRARAATAEDDSASAVPSASSLTPANPPSADNSIGLDIQCVVALFVLLRTRGLTTAYVQRAGCGLHRHRADRESTQRFPPPHGLRLGGLLGWW